MKKTPAFLLNYLNKRPILKKFTGDFIFQVAIKFFSVLFGLWSTRIIAQHLGPTDFGTYSLIFAYISLFQGFVDFNLNPLITRDVCGNVISLQSAAETILHFTSLSSITVYIVFIISSYFFAPTLFPLMILAGLVYFQVPIRELKTLMFINHKIKTVVACHFLGTLSSTLLFFIFLRGSARIGTLIILSLLGTAIGLYAQLYHTKKLVKIQFVPHWLRLFRYFKEASPLVISALIQIFHSRLDLFMLAHFDWVTDISRLMPFSYEPALFLQNFDAHLAIGIYSGANGFFDKLRILPDFVLITGLPIIAAINEKNQFISFKSKLVKMLLLFTLATMGCFYFLAEPVVYFILGEKFINSIPIMKLFSLAIPAIMLRPLFRHIMVLRRFERLVLPLTIASVLVNFTLNLYLIPVHGIMGATVATVISENLLLISLIIGSIYSVKKWKIFKEN